MKDFFISYAVRDAPWAEWIAAQLEQAGYGYSTVIQAWDIPPGSNFVIEMNKAAAGSNRTVAVLSPDYLKSVYGMAEWAAAFTADPTGEKRKLVPVRVRATDADGLLAQIVYVDLVGLDEAAARERLLKGLARVRARPETTPFPGPILPAYPGAVAPPFESETAAQLAALPLDDVAEPGLLPPGSRMPLARNPLFVGREDDLRALARHLKAGETAAVSQVETAAATGLGGIGKTQLACEFVHRYGRFFAGGVFWLSFADPSAVPSEVAACGQRLAGPELDDWTLERQVGWVEDVWQAPLARLLVFDNCEDTELLRRWRPRVGGCRVLVTSRRSGWDPALGVQSLPLGTLPRPKSIALLRGFRPDLGEDSALDEIAAELGDLPLALHLAGSFLARYRHAPAGRPAAYLEQLRHGDLLEHPSLQGRGSEASPTEHERHVARTFALSYERLDVADANDALARSLLARAAFFAAGEPIPRPLLLATAGIGEDNEADLRGEDALKRLTEIGLLEEEADGAVKVHRLVASFARRVGDGKDARAAVEEVICDKASRLNEVGFPAALLAWQVHLRAITDAARQHDIGIAGRLCNALGYHLFTIGDQRGAWPYFERALAIREKVLGAEHPETAQSLNNVGFLLQSRGDLAGARQYFLEARLGPDHPDTKIVRENLESLGAGWQG